CSRATAACRAGCAGSSQSGYCRSPARSTRPCCWSRARSSGSAIETGCGRPGARPAAVFRLRRRADTRSELHRDAPQALEQVAAVVTVWEISGVVRASMGALSRVYDCEDKRPWWLRFPIPIALSLGLTGALVGAILLATVGRSLVHGSWGIPFAIGRWLLAIV